ncbi:MAG: Fe-S cluster assembly protein SufD [Candidatus Kapabacteria bacterium]|jgi:Fe-S cluster assembly protein SufD|nr:Fe-S cluster assembly protein SufD [Candidatus Kapabacteria bacterium]
MQDLQEKLISGFQTVETALNGQAQTPIHVIRKQALKRFAELGFPTIRHEEWKYTNLMSVVKQDYVLGLQTAPNLTKTDIEPFLMPDVEANVLVFVNGTYSADLSTIISDKGVEVMPLSEAFKKKTATVEKHFAQYAAWQNDAMLALNTAFALNGAYIEVAKGAVIEEPFHLLYVNDSRKQSTFAPARNLVIVGANAEATIVESVHTLVSGANVGLTNLVSELVLADNAKLSHYKVQNDVEQSHFVGAIHAHQEATSVLNTVVVTLSGGVVRNNLNAVLAGKAADTHFYGLYLVNGKTLVDNHTLADHAVAHCTSNELYKGIMDDKATGVFNGKIMVRPDAQKTLAYQSNRNILLSPNATVNTKPQLEIFADDVKCSHGCTSGQLDDESLFYLRARGLDKEQARALLLYAFAGEITEKIELEPLRERLESIIAERLHQELL